MPIRFFATLFLSLLVHGAVVAQLQSISHQEIKLPVRDMVYDSCRNVIYVTTDDSIGSPLGNSIISIDPNTLEIVDSFFIGSNPGLMAISEDNSRVYVGIDGARAVRYWEPGTGHIGPLQALIVDFDTAAIVEDIAVFPGDAKTVVVVADALGSTRDGDILLVTDSGVSDIAPDGDANSITFVDDDVLIAYNNTSTGFDVERFQFDGITFQSTGTNDELVRGFGVEIEFGNGLVFATSGNTFDPFQLTFVIDFFPGDSQIQSIADDNTVYFLNGTNLSLFDLSLLTLIDEVEVNLTNFRPPRTLIQAGEDRLAYFTSSAVGVFSNIPASFSPAVVLGDLNGDCVINVLDVSPFVELLSTGGFIVAADINQDGAVNTLDIGPFVDLLSRS